MIKNLIFKMFDFIDYVLNGFKTDTYELPTPVFNREEYNLSPLISELVEDVHPYDGVMFLDTLIEYYPKLGSELDILVKNNCEKLGIESILTPPVRKNSLQELDETLYEMIVNLCLMSRFYNPYSSQLREIDSYTYMPPLDKLYQIEKHLKQKYKFT